MNWEDKGVLFQRCPRASVTSFILENGKLLGSFDVLWGGIDQNRDGTGLAWPGGCSILRLKGV